MQVGLPPTVGQLKDKNPSLQYGIAPIPTKDGSPFTLGVADHLMAFKNKTDKTASIKKFLDYFYSKDVYTKWVKAEGFLPTTKSGADVMGSDETIKPFLDLLPNAQVLPVHQPELVGRAGRDPEPDRSARSGRQARGPAEDHPGEGRRPVVRG